MRVTRRRLIHGGLALTAASLLGLRPDGASAAPGRQDGPGIPGPTPSGPAPATWELTGLNNARVVRLLTPASGAFFAVTGRDPSPEPGAGWLWRSDDAGLTWSPVPEPPRTVAGWTEVDPSNHDVMFADGDGGLYKTDNGGRTWDAVFPSDTPIRRVAVSPADPNVVYAVTAPAYPTTGALRIVRSQDGGVTWELMFQQGGLGGGCYWGANSLSPHPTDPDRLFAIFACVRSAHNELPLQESRDGGRSWSEVAFPPPNDPLVRSGYTPQQARVAFSHDRRLYVGANRPWEIGGSYAFRSDDDGATWNTLLSHRGGGTSFDELRVLPKIDLGGIVADRSAPDRLYVGLTEYGNRGTSFEVKGSRVMTSGDAGATWTEIGQAGAVTINDLALGVDGRCLFCATSERLLRLPLSPGG